MKTICRRRSVSATLGTRFWLWAVEYDSEVARAKALKHQASTMPLGHRVVVTLFPFVRETMGTKGHRRNKSEGTFVLRRSLGIIRGWWSPSSQHSCAGSEGAQDAHCTGACWAYPTTFKVRRPSVSVAPGHGSDMMDPAGPSDHSGGTGGCPLSRAKVRATAWVQSPGDDRRNPQAHDHLCCRGGAVFR